jgi:hypothetical protein
MEKDIKTLKLFHEHMARVFGNSLIHVMNQKNKMPIFVFITQPPYFKQIHHNQRHCKILNCMSVTVGICRLGTLFTLFNTIT